MDQTMEMKKSTSVTFTLNDVEYTVTADEVTPSTVLNNFIRNTLHLTGTKKMCFEGGCGSCIVAVERTIDNKKTVSAVMSCMQPLLSCDGWKIKTIEGIGGPITSYHKIQKLLAENDGTQCGFCSPGMVMNMYALHESGPKTMKEIENSFAGNMCRCTGYRSILTAFKKLASDYNEDEVEDIEDIKPCQKVDAGKCCGGSCSSRIEKTLTTEICYLEADGKKWYNVSSLSALLSILKNIGTTPYMLVAGNTGHGVYTLPTSDVYINVNSVSDLTKHSFENDALTLGGNVTLNKFMDVAKDIANKHTHFKYLSDIADHLDLVASIPVRNVGTIAGNLMLKYLYNEFQSDVFLLLETFNAKLTIVDCDANESETTPEAFLKLDMSGKVIKQVTLSAHTDSAYKYKSYKMMRRAQNAHAIVNAGFLLGLSSSNIVESARIVYGAINPSFVHATRTEAYLVGKHIFDNTVLAEAFTLLDGELEPNYVQPDPSPEIRKGIAIALFYKFILSIAPKDCITAKYISGGTIFDRPVSSGVQIISPISENFPLTQPIHKIEGLAQTSGQAEYIADIPDFPNQLHGAFVIAQAAPYSVIASIDTKDALASAGVVAFFSASDIPGTNTFMSSLEAELEELFCSGTVQYYNQAIGMIVADTHANATAATAKVKVTYTVSSTTPLVTTKAVLDANDTDRIATVSTVTATSTGTDITHTIKGTFELGPQYHYHMEVQCTSVVPTEDGLELYPATQNMDRTQQAVAEALNIPRQKISVHVRRLGGGFGAKLSRNNIATTAAALAAYKLRRPVRVWTPLKTNMSMIGGRFAPRCEYEVSVNDKGVIQKLDAKLYSDMGVAQNESNDFALVPCFKSCYDYSTWNFSTHTVKTDTSAKCYARAPGSVEAIGAIESIMENIASELGLNPIDVKLGNLDSKNNQRILEFWNTMKTWSEVEKKESDMETFNEENRWKKRGLSVVPMRFEMAMAGPHTAIVSIFHGDGGVMISHSGIEMGQGINTKAAQVCAYKLGISVDQIQIRPSYNLVVPNCNDTGGSITSEHICYAISKACDNLLARMNPIKHTMSSPTWKEWVNECYTANIQLTDTATFTIDEPGIQIYNVWGLCFTEVEVDILTGQYQILNVDILEDVGESMSPLIDLGQIEGAYVMGLGYYTTEEIVFDDKGNNLTNRTWTYKPPGAKDIPQNFRVWIPGNIPNPMGVLRSKAVAEPPLCLSVGVPLAIRHALLSARKETDPSSSSKWIMFDGATTPEKTFLYALNDYKQYQL
ncbi:hypothetical protein JTB14_025195 [Gonioctena quinquepunctata]|nr:hypothetical protein JTB14_025195 [Gonioctena quinquepunctata]